jgi:hypothetical protein
MCALFVRVEREGIRQYRVLQPSGQRIDCVGQSKRGGAEFVCDMERKCGGTEGDSDERWVVAAAEESSECRERRRRRACNGLVWHRGSRGNPPNGDWLVKVSAKSWHSQHSEHFSGARSTESFTY